MTKRELTLIGVTILVMSVPLALAVHANKPQATLPSSAIEWNTIKAVLTKVGEKRQFCDSPTETLENLEIHATTLNPGEFAHAAHQHPEEELTV